MKFVGTLRFPLLQFPSVYTVTVVECDISKYSKSMLFNVIMTASGEWERNINLRLTAEPVISRELFCTLVRDLHATTIAIVRWRVRTGNAATAAVVVAAELDAPISGH